MRATRQKQASPAGAAAPPVSVVMPVHNGLPYLDESIRSILDQTFRDFEFIILDDGSTDATGEALRDWQKKDRRIRVLGEKRRLGPAGSSNRAAAEASAPLVARMDADDVAHPERLARQLRVFREHPRAELVATLWEGIDERGRRVRPRDRWRLARRSPFAPFPHGSIMFRRETFSRAGGYREACAYWEDLDLYLRLAAAGRVLVITDALYRYRFHLNGARLASEQEGVERAVALMHRCIAERRAGRDYTPLLDEAHGAARQNGGGKLPPAVFTSLGSSRLWAGRRPGVLGQLWRRGAIGWDRATALALAWATWGEASPSSLRFALRCLTRSRDAAAGRWLGEGGVREWRFE
jgi:hypothetical protein